MRKEEHLLRQLAEQEQPELTPQESKRLKKLQKHDFLVNEGGNYKLTERGRIASEIGLKEFLKLEKTNRSPSAERKWLRGGMGISFFFILLLCLYVCYILFSNTHVIGS